MVELTMPDLAAAMRVAVRGLVDRLDTEQRRQLVFPFDGDMHKRWTCLFFEIAQSSNCAPEMQIGNSVIRSASSVSGPECCTAS